MGWRSQMALIGYMRNPSICLNTPQILFQAGQPIMEESMNTWKRMCGCVALMATLVAFSGCVKGGIKYGPPPGRQAVQIMGGTSVKLPPAASLPVEAPGKNFVERLGNGYARIGGVSYINFTQNWTEEGVKQILLKEAQRYGAEAISFDPISQKSIFEFDTDYGAYVKTGDSRYTQFSDKHYTAEYRYVQGGATLFIRDPELAAKQLKEGRSRWEKKAAVIKEYQQVLLGKLTVLEDAVRGYDVSVFKIPTGKDYLINMVASAKRTLLSGQGREPNTLLTANMFVSHCLPNEYSSEWAKGTQMNQFLVLVFDARRYAETNSFLFDYAVLGDPNKFIWE